MKLLEKLKNTFFEEEEIMVEEPVKKTEVVARKVEPTESKIERKPEDILNETEEELIEESKNEYFSDNELSKKDNKVQYFDEDDFLENDFEENSYAKEEPRKIYGQSVDELYNSINYTSSVNNKPYGAPLKEAFKPTPVISPIYGILDKNYKKEEVVDRKDKPSSYVSRRNADLDSIRKKAYGGLEPFDDVTKQPEPETNQEEDGLLYDMTSDNSKPAVNQVTIADAEEYFEDLGLEYNVDYKDNAYEKATGRRTSSNKKIDIVEPEEDANLEDNLFDLIDSMYEGGEE